MTFRIADLMISTVSGETFRTTCCPATVPRGITDRTGCRPATVLTQFPDRTGCRPATVMICAVSSFTADPQTILATVTAVGGIGEQEASPASLDDLRALKEQLRQELSHVDQQLSEAESGMLPQTVEQVDQLSKKLADALEVLRRHRDNLSQKRKSEGG